jgi:CTD small phosphatase-like protein 2
MQNCWCLHKNEIKKTGNYNVDLSLQAFGFQVDNGIPVESWFDDKSDTGLLRLLPFLESLVGVDDVRPVITEKFHLHRKNAQAAIDH